LLDSLHQPAGHTVPDPEFPHRRHIPEVERYIPPDCPVTKILLDANRACIFRNVRSHHNISMILKHMIYFGMEYDKQQAELKLVRHKY
jgi:hypothetical protein